MAVRFIDDETDVDADALNSLDRGGNVYEYSGGGLKIDVSAFWYYGPGAAAMAPVQYAGATNQSVTQSTTNYVYLNDAGTLVINTTGFPTTTPHIPLATVTTDATSVSGVTDRRAVMQMQPGPYLMPDPTTGDPILVAGWMHALLAFTIGAAAETNTIADASRAGQRLQLCVNTIGAGSREVTFASPFDASANVKWKADAVTEGAEFVSDVNLKWNLVFNRGGTLTP